MLKVKLPIFHAVIPLGCPELSAIAPSGTLYCDASLNCPELPFIAKRIKIVSVLMASELNSETCTSGENLQNCNSGHAHSGA